MVTYKTQHGRNGIYGRYNQARCRDSRDGGRRRQRYICSSLHDSFEEIKNFLAGVHEMEEKESLQYSYDKPKRIEVVLAAFDPNSADSIEFLQCGLLSSG